MGGEEHEGVDGHAIMGLGLADDAENEVRELRRGFEQQPALQGASGDLDEGIFGDKAKWSRHPCISASDLAVLLRPKSGWLRTAPPGKEDSGTAIETALGKAALAPPSRNALGAFRIGAKLTNRRPCLSLPASCGPTAETTFEE